MITLGIETSCDETAASVVADGRVLSTEVSSSVHLHQEYGGVVPEIASRFHVEYIFGVLEKALKDAECSITDIDLVAVANRPGLPGSLLVGAAFAKAISYAAEIPVIGVNHIKAHMFSPFIDNKGGENIFPFLGMVISGGHTSIYSCRSVKDSDLIGRTRDDAVGEAFDKVAKILGLGYPGGPLVEKRAAGYTSKETINFPRAFLQNDGTVDFSFSGLKTAVLYYWRDSEKSEKEKDKICYSFQKAVFDVIDRKISDAVEMTQIETLAAGGGVLNNGILRKRITSRCREEGIELFLPEKAYCADNAAMIAFLGEKLFIAGERSDLYLNVEQRVETSGIREKRWKKNRNRGKIT